MISSLVLALIVGAGSSQAQSDALISQGVELRQNGKDEDALALFRKAHELSPSGRALAQIGLVEAALGRYIDAETDLTAALAMKDPWVETNRANLTTTLTTAAGKLGWLEIAAKPAGARIKVNNQDFGRAPLRRAVRLVAGSAAIEVDAPGYQTIARKAVITGGATTRESFDLKTQALDKSGVRASDAARLSANEPALVPPPEPEPESATSKVPTLAWITGGATVVGAGVGAAGTVLQLTCADPCESSAGVVLMAVGFGVAAVMAGLTVLQLIDAEVIGGPSL